MSSKNESNPPDPGDELSPLERAALHQALADSQEDLAAGRLVDAEEVLRELRTSKLSPSLKDVPIDDEPLTPEEEQALAEAHADLAEGRVVSHAEARLRLGFSRPGGAKA